MPSAASRSWTFANPNAQTLTVTNSANAIINWQGFSIQKNDRIVLYTDGVDETRERRRKESQDAAALLGATWHPPLCGDLEIIYELALMRRLAAVDTIM